MKSVTMVLFLFQFDYDPRHHYDLIVIFPMNYLHDYDLIMILNCELMMIQLWYIDSIVMPIMISIWIHLHALVYRTCDFECDYGYDCELGSRGCMDPLGYHAMGHLIGRKFVLHASYASHNCTHLSYEFDP